MKVSRSNLKKKAFEILGNICVGCCEEDVRLLEFSHINRDRKQHIKEQTYSTKEKYIVENPEEAKKRIWLMCSSCHRIYDNYPKVWDDYSKRKKLEYNILKMFREGRII